jgi:hypothetical protein
MFGNCRRHNQERRASARRGAVMRTLSREHHTLFSSDRIHDQERRALARRGSNSRLQRRLLLWTDYVSPRTFASHTTAGSRQPLLLRDARSVRNARFAMHKRTSARAAGVSPPWFRKCTCRAAGVSPPWFEHHEPTQRDCSEPTRHARPPTVSRTFGNCIAERTCYERLVSHGGLTPPALVLVYGRLPAEQRLLRCTNARQQERRASARRGSVTRTLSREHHTLFSSDRIHNQERRGVRPPWFEFALATATAFVD